MRSDEEIRAWVNERVGRPWTMENNCWGLVREAFSFLYGLVLPPVVGLQDSLETRQALRAAALASGWRPVVRRPTTYEHGDVVLLRSSIVGRHVGIMVKLGRTLRLFHCEGCPTNPRPGVLWEQMQSVLTRFSEPECWHLRSNPVQSLPASDRC